MAEKEIDRKVAIILATDVVNYSKHMEANESETVKNLRACELILQKVIKKHDGRLFNSGGDSFFIEFPSAVEAVECAVAFQTDLKKRNSSDKITVPLEFRIGISMGDVIKEKENLLGDGVNIAARLEALAQTNGITISKNIYDLVKAKTSHQYNDLGIQKVKKNEFHAYDILLDPSQKRKLKTQKSNKPILAIAASFLVIAVVSYYFLFLPENENLTAKADQPSIIVSKIQNNSGDKKLNYISTGITNSIITALSSYSQLAVQSMNTTEYITKENISDKDLVSKYGIDYKIFGNFQVSGKKIRINFELINLNSNEIILSEKYDFNNNDFFQVQDEISKLILKELGVNLTMGSQATTWMNLLENLEQYQLFMEGRASWQLRNEAAYYRTEELWGKLISQLPENHPFVPGLKGWLKLLRVTLKMDNNPLETAGEIIELSKLCSEFSPKLADCYSLRAFVEGTVLNNWSAAKLSADKIIEIGATGLDAMSVAATVFGNNGDWNKASSTYKKVLASTIHPPSFLSANYMRSLMELKQFDEAKIIAENLYSKDHITPEYKSLGLAVLIYIELKMNNIDLANEYFDILINLDPKLSETFIRKIWTNQNTEFVNDLVIRLNDLGL